VLAEEERVVDERRRGRAERGEQPPMHCLVRTVVVAADDVGDPEVDVVHDRGELVRRGSVVAEERHTVEPRAELLRSVPVAVGPIALTYRTVVPLNAEPFEALHNRV